MNINMSHTPGCLFVLTSKSFFAIVCLLFSGKRDYCSPGADTFMATKPKEKPEAASKPTPKTTPKTATPPPETASPQLSETVQAVPETVKKAPAKKKSAVKAAETAESKVVSGTVEEVSSAPEQQPESETVKPDIVKDEQEPVPPQKSNKWHEIKVILEKMKEDTLIEIEKSVKNGTDAIATNEPGGDIYDQASSERDRELGLLLGDREREKLHSVDEALQRIVENEYGICEECDEDIPLGRLKAMPFTRHCVKCKSDLEKLQAQTKRFEEDRAYREIPLGSEEEEG